MTLFKNLNEAVEYFTQEYNLYDAIWKPYINKLSNGTVVVYPHLLDGGGADYMNSIAECIKQYGGKKKYNRSFEWCCGHGIINYNLYDQGLCDTLVFSDMYFVAVENVILTAQINKIEDKVTSYLARTIDLIPDTEKFDLVISNPPHCQEQSLTDGGFTPDTHIYYANSHRLVVDEDWKTHEEFFRNIRSRLTDDADVFIWEVNNFNGFIELAERHNLKCVNIIDPNYEPAPSNRILHFNAV